MTAKTKYIIKMVLVMFLILATPAIFFGSIGDKPLLVRENATRTIAVVNEDIGADKESKSLDFGKEITSILKEGSEYDWTVISRSTAANGLRNTKYDAVVYIPSDFSRNIMSYESKQPVKAKFEYTIQNQLNSLNREKVLREIQTATSRVNGKISTLYWTYVSQDLENVRSKFDNILQKEIDFQNTMLAFYKPSSKNLAAEIEQQRNMLEGIQSSVKIAADSFADGESNITQFEQNLKSFVLFVEQYKEYQATQQETLQKLQDKNVLSIQTLAGSQAPRYSESVSFLNEGGLQLTNSLQSVESQLLENNKMLGDLSNIRTGQIDTKRTDFIEYLKLEETNSINQTIQTIVSLKNDLSGETKPGNPDPPGNTNKSFANKNTNQVSAANSDTSTPSIEAERLELQAIVKEINTVKTSLETIVEPKPEQVVLAINSLPQLSQRLLTVEQKLAAIESSENPLQKVVDELQAQNAKLTADINNLLEENSSLKDQVNSSVSFSSLINLIEEKEQQVLSLGLYLDTLPEVFDQSINNTDPVKMMEYYSSLVHLEGAIKDSFIHNQEKMNALQEKLNSTLSVNEEEQMAWDQLNTALPYSQEQVTYLEGQLETFFNEYRQKIEIQQAAIESDLSLVKEHANSVMEQIQSFSANTPTPADGSDGNAVKVKQEGISQSIVTMNDLIGSIGENQDNIVGYTSELETKVQTVQQDADTLNSKWGTNVETTRMFRDDIFNVLGNAYVNGQKNGPVYEQLSNPLQISGETAVKKEENKLPPVVVLAIILISSLLIGYFSHYFKNAPMLVHAAMFILLNLIVGLIISLYGLNIYPMGEERAIQWTIFTILLLTAASAVVLTGFKIGSMAGWIASVGLVIFFVSPFLALTAPNINYEDPMSKVYMSIQYDSSSLFIPAIIILIGIITLLTILPFTIRFLKNLRTTRDEDQAYEA